MSGRTLSGFATTALVGIALLAARPAAQQDQESVTFRSSIRTIEVDVLVTDRNGTVVRDLRKEDFTVLEDGTPQTIATASFIDLEADSPVTRVRPDVPESDIATNAGVGRTWVMLLGNSGERARIAARTFVERASSSSRQRARHHEQRTGLRWSGSTGSRNKSAINSQLAYG